MAVVVDTEKNEMVQSLGLGGMCTYSKYIYNQSVETTLCVKVEGLEEAQTEEEQNSKREPMDIMVVLDKSGSMSGEPLRLCKLSMDFFTKELTEKDRLGIVTYDSNVDVTLPLRQMDNVGKAAANHAVNNIRAGSCTNLSGGLFQGFEELKKTAADTIKSASAGEKVVKRRRALLLLTDGLANEGVTDTQKILQLSQSYIQQLEGDVKTYTFGYGTNHNADLLEKLSAAGSGNYFFINDVDDVPLAFADCLGGLSSIVAQSVKLQLKPAGGANFVGNPMTKFTYQKADDQGFEINIPDIRECECKHILIKVRLPELTHPMHPGEKAPVAFATLNYLNVVHANSPKLDFTIDVERPGELTPAEMKEALQEEVQSQELRYEAIEAMAKAKEAADQNRLDEGRGYLRRMNEKIASAQQSSSYVRDHQVVKNLMSDLMDSEQQMESASRWHSSGEKEMRNNLCEYGFEQCHKPSKKKSSSYLTKKQAVYRSRVNEAVESSLPSQSSAPPSSAPQSSFPVPSMFSNIYSRMTSRTSSGPRLRLRTPPVAEPMQAPVSPPVPTAVPVEQSYQQQVQQPSQQVQQPSQQVQQPSQQVQQPSQQVQQPSQQVQQPSQQVQQHQGQVQE